MKAIQMQGHGSPEVMHYVDVDIPSYAAEEVLIKVHAVGVNRCDLIQRDGSYQRPLSNRERLGIELSGVVVACGDKVRNISVGDRVFGYVNGGAYAQYCAEDARLLNLLPDDWTFEQGASVAEAFQVGYEILFTESGLRSGQTILVYAGASSLGLAVIQLAKHHQAHVVVTTSTSEKETCCLSLGADHVIQYKTQDVIEQLSQFTHNEGVDLIVDPVGPINLAQNFSCLKPDSTMIMIGVLGGNSAEFNVLPFIAKRATMRSYNTRGRSKEYQYAIVERFQKYCLPLLQEKKISMIIDRVFDLQEVSEAHIYMHEDKNIGKVILAVSH